MKCAAGIVIAPPRDATRYSLSALVVFSSIRALAAPARVAYGPSVSTHSAQSGSGAFCSDEAKVEGLGMEMASSGFLNRQLEREQSSAMAPPLELRTIRCVGRT